MFDLTKRIKILRDDAVNIKSHAALIEHERLVWYNRGVLSAPADKTGNNAFLCAAGIATVINNFNIFFTTGQLLAGNNFGINDWFPGDYKNLAETLQKQGMTPEDARRAAFEDEEARKRFSHPTFPHPNENEKMLALADELSIVGYPTTSNHSVIAYEKVLQSGFEGLLSEINTAENKSKNGFYAPIRLLCEAACTLGERYAAHARDLIKNETESERKAELDNIAEICTQVPRYPARTFAEAVQSFWFAHIINTWEDGINANSLGRLDQLLYPYYKRDIEKGILTKEHAFEILCCLWIKLYRDYDVQQSCVGGCDENGIEAVNELSYLMLDVTQALDFVRCISVRFSPATNKNFLCRALEVVGNTGKGMPFFFNDDVFIPALCAQGIDIRDARDYAQIGCVETVIPGKSNPHAVAARANLLKAVEYTMLGGQSAVQAGVFPGIEQNICEIKAYPDFENAVFAQMRHIITNAYLMTVDRIAESAAYDPKPYKSLLTDGCLSSGRDINDCGSLYDYYQMMLMGIPNLADSLAAVRELVFEKRRYTLGQLESFLRYDWPDETARLEFINKAPKFGNDIPEVDEIAYRIYDYACDCLFELSSRYGHFFQAQPFTFVWMIEHGRTTGATPDGRKKGEILAYSMSPMQGRDHGGFTAVLNSLTSLPTAKAAGTTSAIVEIEPLLFSSAYIGYICDAMLTSAQKGLSNIQFNVIDEKTLRDAQLHPDAYPNLAVRVSGFSQKFCLLDKTMQDHIISRTKHSSI